MNTTKLIGCLLAAITLLAGCVAAPNGDHEPLTREEARRLAGNGIDYCEIHSWYGDGICDDFCEDPDPDCLLTCDATIACSQGYAAVESCAPEADCEVIQGCGSTLICQKNVPTCLAYPACPPDTHEVTACNFDDQVSCSEHSLCGSTILCEQNLNHCEAYPSCPEDATEVASCDTDFAECSQVSVCGYTIFCEQNLACRAIPTCPEGQVQVEKCPEGASCSEHTKCGSTILCSDDMLCDGIPICPDGSLGTPTCATDAECVEVSLCGYTTFCPQI